MNSHCENCKIENRDCLSSNSKNNWENLVQEAQCLTSARFISSFDFYFSLFWRKTKKNSCTVFAWKWQLTLVSLSPKLTKYERWNEPSISRIYTFWGEKRPFNILHKISSTRHLICITDRNYVNLTRKKYRYFAPGNLRQNKCAFDI